MNHIKITIQNCHPGGKPERASRKARDHVQWRNSDATNCDVVFGADVPAIFLGFPAAPRFTVPAHGSIELELEPSPQDNQERSFAYTIHGDCPGITVFDAHVIIAGP